MVVRLLREQLRSESFLEPVGTSSRAPSNSGGTGFDGVMSSQVTACRLAILISVVLTSVPALGIENYNQFTRPKTYNDLKYSRTVRQERDFTCGAAALATILKYHYDMPVTEYMIMSMILERYSFEQWKQKVKDGLSFEDLIFVAKKLGFEAVAATIALQETEKLGAPVIIQLDMNKSDHFVVLRKKTAEFAYLSDPITGNMTLDQKEFKEKFRGAILAVWPSYATDGLRSVLSTVRDPVSVNRALESTIRLPMISPITP